MVVMTRHITKPTPLPVVVKWPGKLDGRSNHHFTGMLAQSFLPYLEENHTPGYSRLQFFFSTDGEKVSESAMLLCFIFGPILTAYSFSLSV
jgi:hypothetical protein